MTSDAARYAASLASILEGCHIWRAWLKDVHGIAPKMQQSRMQKSFRSSSWQLSMAIHWSELLARVALNPIGCMELILKVQKHTQTCLKPTSLLTPACYPAVSSKSSKAMSSKRSQTLSQDWIAGRGKRLGRSNEIQRLSRQKPCQFPSRTSPISPRTAGSKGSCKGLPQTKAI